MSRTVVITGAGGGLGSIFAKEFAKTGYRVAILDFNIQAGQKVACEIEQAGGDAAAFQVDVTDKASLERARDAVVQHFGSYEVLINCAGIQDPLAKPPRKLMPQATKRQQRSSRSIRRQQIWPQKRPAFWLRPVPCSTLTAISCCVSWM